MAKTSKKKDRAEGLKALEAGLGDVEREVSALAKEMKALRIYTLAMQQDISTLYDALDAQDRRLDRIEKKLGAGDSIG